MSGILKKTTIAAAGFLLALVLTSDVAHAQSTAAGPAPKMADQVFKNIQVMKGVPAGLMGPTMEFFRSSLGTGCTFCHVSEQYPLEDKPAKQVARNMMLMTIAINKNSFEGRVVVTCYTCHQGNLKPVGIFPVISPEPKPARSESEVGKAVPGGMPTGDQLLDKYIGALGGAGAIRRISSRLEKGTVTDIDGNKFPLEILSKAPAKRIVVMHAAKGDVFWLYNGDMGWARTPGEAVSGSPAHEMRKEDIDQARLEDPLLFAGRVKQLFSDLRVERTEKVEGREAYVVSGPTVGSDAGVSVAKLYLDKESGLLVRLVYYGESLFGDAPLFQSDYADYRNADGVKIPFRWTINKPRPGPEQRLTYQVDEVQQNIPIEDSKFVVPATVECWPPRCLGPTQH